MTEICTNTACIPTKSTPYRMAATTRLISGMLKTRTQRRALAQLDIARLEDLGLSFDHACSEVNRPFWDVPAHWRQ